MIKIGLFIEKLYGRYYSKFIVPLKEKEKIINNEKVHYLFYPAKSDVLLIVFSARHPAGARYNYISTLSKFKVNKLFIKDDFIEKGDFYLGRNGDFHVEDAVFQLIDSIIRESKAKKLIFIGSSKGGFAALNFGFKYPGSTMIVGSPQYKLGTTCLNHPDFHDAFKDITGVKIEDASDELIETLDDRVKNKIDGEHRVFLHCSINELNYEENVAPLLKDIEGMCEFDKGYYAAHADLKYHFPGYLKKKLREIIDG